MFKLRGAEIKYSYSFKAASLKFLDFLRPVWYMEEQDYQSDIADFDSKVNMQRTNSRTNKIGFQKLIERYKLLTERKKAFISQIDLIFQKQRALIGLCMANPFIQEFIIEVLRKKNFSLDFKLQDGNYQTFINRKLPLNPELEGFSDCSEKKERHDVWRILKQAGLIYIINFLITH